MEQLQRVVLFSGTHELHGLPGDLLDRQGRAAARIAVHFRQDEAVEAKLLVELLSAFHGVLPEHGVCNEQDLVGVQNVFEFVELLHQSFVDVETARRIDDHDIVSRVARFAHSILRELKRFVVGIAFPQLHADIFCDDF